MFGDCLKKLRKEKDVSQQDVAKALGVSRQVYNNYELEKREPDHKMLVRIADYYGVTVDYLLGRVNVPVFVLEKDIETPLEKEAVLKNLIVAENFSDDDGDSLKEYLDLLRIRKMQRNNSEISDEQIINFEVKK